MDLGAVLPVVGEEEPFMDSDPYAAPAMGTRKRQRQVHPGLALGASFLPFCGTSLWIVGQTASLSSPLAELCSAMQGASDGGSGGTGTYGTLSQYQLLEESAPEATAQAPSITDSMSHSSLAFIQCVGVGYLLG